MLIVLAKCEVSVNGCFITLIGVSVCVYAWYVFVCVCVYVCVCILQVNIMIDTL